jgi:nucleotide-binding universal stress UspA family protein
MFLNRVQPETTMPWKPIVVGIDATHAPGRAAQLGLEIAAAAGVECRLVHAARDAWSALAAAEIPLQAVEFRDAALTTARNSLSATLTGRIPPEALRHAVIREGWPPAVIDDIVRETDAALLVLGAKHHTALGRWLGGSTVHNVARMLRVPLLVVGDAPPSIRRVLVAVDTSAAARPTLETATRLADLFDAELRVLHVVEPLPILPEVPVTTDPREYVRLLEEECAERIWPLVDPSVEKTMRHTTPEAGIAEEAKAWEADLVVVGSHGKGFVQRMLVGSVTERLLHHLPAALLLVVPAGKTSPAAAVPSDPARLQERSASPPSSATATIQP